MFVEDLIKELTSSYWPKKKVSLDQWSSDFLLSLRGRIDSNNPLSTKQCNAFFKLLKKNKHSLMDYEREIDLILAKPEYRISPYHSVEIKKEVRYLGGNMLGFRFKRKENQKADALLDNLSDKTREFIEYPYFDNYKKIWMIPVLSENLSIVMNFIAYFDYDHSVIEYLTLCEKNMPSTFFIDETGKILANICDNNFLNLWVKDIVCGEIL